MTKNKKIIATVLIVVLLLLIGVLILVNTDRGPSLQESVNQRVSAYETDIKDSMESFKDKASVTKYLVNWAESKSIDVNTDYYGNVIYSIPATKKAADKNPIVIICGYDYKCMDSYINGIVTALSVSKTTAEHEDLKIIFVSENEDDRKALKNLSAEYFTDETETFYLKDMNKAQLSMVTGGYQQYSISKTYQQTLPQNSKAYTIKLKGLPAGSVNLSTVEGPNPIEQLGKLLAKFKSNYINFELASFTGGTASNITPSSASMTIIVDDDATAKLEKVLNSDIEKFTEKYSEKYPDAQYSYKVVKTPERVVDKDISEQLVSFMYTLLNGIYSTEDDQVTSLVNVGQISIKDGQISLNVLASSFDKDTLSEIKSAYQTISVLAGMDFSVSDKGAIFKSNDKSSAVCEKLQESYNSFQKNEVKVRNMPEYTPCSILSEKNKNMSIVVLGISKKTKDDFTGALINHMQ